MPLIKSASKKAFSDNVSAERSAGRPMKQALAIAYDVQRRAKKAVGGAVAMPFAAPTARSGLIRSPVAGRKDRLPMNAKVGGYVVPADVVSGIGQGNSLSGATALDRLFKSAPNAAMSNPRAMKMPTGGMIRGPRGFNEGGAVDDGVAPTAEISTAGGEYWLNPTEVMQVGGGDLDRGHAVLDAFVGQIRKQTIRTLRGLPGPKKS